MTGVSYTGSKEQLLRANRRALPGEPGYRLALVTTKILRIMNGREYILRKCTSRRTI